MSRISKKLISRLVVLGLATSVGALGLAVSTADLALAAEVEVAAAIGAVAGTLALPMSMPGARTFPLTFPPTLRIGAAAVTATQRITAERIRAGSTRTLAI
jgi:hypothetical protein